MSEAGEATKERIAAAALRLFVEQGVEATGIPDLATALVMGLILQPATFKVHGRITKSMTALALVLAGDRCKVLGEKRPIRRAPKRGRP